MNNIKGVLLCIIALGVSGCTGKYSKFNPFTDDNHFDTAFGYPPKVLAKFYDLEDSLTVDPSELTLNPSGPLKLKQSYWKLALPAGLEPATSGLENRCSIQLSYASQQAEKIIGLNTNFDNANRTQKRVKLC